MGNGMLDKSQIHMSATYAKVYIQAVFAVKYRQALINDSFSASLYRYMGGLIKEKGHIPLKINGMPDHIHLAISLRPRESISDLMRFVKANSSRWINQQGFLECKFAWQRGFGVFSYGESQVPRLKRYIENQKIHHQKRTFKEEYLKMLKLYNINYDEKLLFNWELE